MDRPPPHPAAAAAAWPGPHLGPADFDDLQAKECNSVL